MAITIKKSASRKKSRVFPSRGARGVTKAGAILKPHAGSVAAVGAKSAVAETTLAWAAHLSPISLIETSKQGIRAHVVKSIQKETGFSNGDLAEYLQVNNRTLQRYLQRDRLMSPEVSERALLVAQIADLGREVFGDEELFKSWLSAPSAALGGMKPESLLNSATGIHLIRAELNRIEHGVY